MRRWLDGYTRAGIDYPPVIRERSTGDDAVTWGEFVELGYLRKYRHAGVTLQGLRPFVTRLRDEFGIPHPLAHKCVYLAERLQLVVIDPARAFGIPTIRGIRIEVLFEAFEEGDSVETLADDFDVKKRAPADRSGGCAMASHWHRTS